MGESTLTHIQPAPTNNNFNLQFIVYITLGITLGGKGDAKLARPMPPLLVSFLPATHCTLRDNHNTYLVKVLGCKNKSKGGFGQNQAWIARDPERSRNAQRKLAEDRTGTDRPGKPESNKRKPGQTPAAVDRGWIGVGMPCIIMSK